MFVSGDDFDAILEEDEAIDHHFTSVIKEVSITLFIRIESFSNDEGNATENLTWTKRFAQLWLFYDHPFFAFYSSFEVDLK